MQKPMGRIDSIAASGIGIVPGVIPFVRARTLSITVRLTFGASIDADADVYLYYSPDGRNWDTIAFTSWAITYTASGVVQHTVIVDPPEHGNMAIKITNGSQADTIDEAVVWYSIQSWPDFPAQSRGLIETADVYD